MELARQFGPIFRVRTPGGDVFVASGLEMIDDLCDDERFDKLVGGGQKAIRSLGSSAGLFTSDTDDPNWSKAHNILLPNFSTQAMRDYLPMMNDIAAQLMQKWERLNPGEPVDVTADTTRLTLDTIALCGFGYRFNSFYRDTQHPYVSAMMELLMEGQKRSRELPIMTKMRRGAQQRLTENIRYMEREVQGILDERRRSGDAEDHKDLLSCMLTGVDKRTGEKLSDANIVAQCQTFLVAGHETTSGLLSFAIQFLLKHPEVVARAEEEVDRVLGTDTSILPSYQQVQGLTYITQILNETLRLYPTAPAFTRYPYEDALVGGYLLPKGSSITALDDHVAPRPQDLGRRRRGVQPRPLPTGDEGVDAGQRLQALRLGSAGLHRPAVRHAGSRPGARHADAAVRVRGHLRLPAQDQGEPDRQAGRPEDHSPAASRPNHRNEPRRRRAGASPVRGTRATSAARRGAQHPPDGPVRIQSGDRRGDCDQDRPGRRPTGATP